MPCEKTCKIFKLQNRHGTIRTCQCEVRAKKAAKFYNALNEDYLFNCKDHVHFHKINALGTLK